MSAGRTGDWIATNSGTKWFIMDPVAEDVRLSDIAHALANVCRFGGHCRTFYSVAQHSVLVSRAIAQWHPENYVLQLHGLFHDAPEAYLGDVVRPLKVNLPLYKAVEHHTELVIFRAFDIPPITDEERAIVKRADDALLATERRDLVNHCGHEWSNKVPPLEETITPWSSKSAVIFFERRWEELFKLAGRLPMPSVLGIEGSPCT